jgi:hypothetical protein
MKRECKNVVLPTALMFFWQCIFVSYRLVKVLLDIEATTPLIEKIENFNLLTV